MALQNQYGLGYSPLSIKYVPDNASTQESVANKEVGMYGIVVDDDRHIMSIDYATREKYQMQYFINRLIADNTIGRLYKLLVDDQLVRTIQNDNTNLLEDGENLFINHGYNYIKGVRFNFDLDWLVKDNHNLRYNLESANHEPIRIKIVMRISIGVESVRQIINDTITNINCTAYALDYTGLERASGDVILTFDSITIIPPPNFDYDENVLALYDILLAVIPDNTHE